jgi:murein DD-endopeptidase MepM/ murein hydrolase activator NlpD
MSRKRAKSRDKITVKMSRDGAVERNLTSGEDTRISKRSADYDLRGEQYERAGFSQVGKNDKAKRKHHRRVNNHNPAGNSAAANTESQTADLGSDAPQQSENAADPQIIADDERRDAHRESHTQSGGVAKQTATGGKSKPPPKQPQQYADFSEQSQPSPPMMAQPQKSRVDISADPAPRSALRQEESALKHDNPESPLKTEESSELKFTRDESAPSVPSSKPDTDPHTEQRSELKFGKVKNSAPPQEKRQGVKPQSDDRQQDTADAPAESGGVPASVKPDGDTPPPSAGISSDGTAIPTTELPPHKEAETPPKDGESPLKPDKPGKLKFAEDETASTPPTRSEVNRQKRYDKAQQQADKAVTKLDKAKSKLPAKKKLQSKTVVNDKTGKAKRKLCFESEVKSQSEHIKGAKPLRPVKAAGNSALMFAHTKIYQVERENVATEAAHKSEIFAEGAIRAAIRHHKTAPYTKVAKLERVARKKYVNAVYQKALAENPKIKSNPLSRALQKRKIKKDCAKAAREAKKTAERAGKAGGVAGNAGKALAGVIKRHPVATAAVALIILLLFCLMSLIGVFGSAGSGGLSGLMSASYLAEDADIDAAELVCTEWETDLQIQAANTESSHPGYDEYRYNVGEISHNPYELLAYLTAKYRNFSYTAIYADLQALFNEQYSLMFTPMTETRYADPSDSDEDGDYEPYDWQVLTVALTAQSFSEVAVSQLNGEEAEHYAILMQTKGARQYFANPFGDLNWLPYVTSNYGYRIHPISGEKNHHKGVDIGLPAGTPIQSGQDGTVTFAGYSGDYGNVVIIESADGIVSKYAHCDTLSVAAGQSVNSGDVIATVGNTGNSNGVHLHVEALKNGQYLNPLLFIETGSYTADPTYGYAGSPMGDGTFEALIAEAEKHLGKPYIFGANGPNAFDCSSFVSWALTYSGVKNTGRLTAAGLYGVCDPVSPSEAMPGDLVFWEKTYSTASPITHVAIYVGKMNGRDLVIHAGSPIQYTYIDTPYWQSHFYGFGRVKTE